MENPLLDDSNELYDLHTKLAADPYVTKNLFVLKKTGEEQHKDFMDACLWQKDKILLRHYPQTLRKDEQLKSARNNKILFSRLSSKF